MRLKRSKKCTRFLTRLATIPLVRQAPWAQVLPPPVRRGTRTVVSSTAVVVQEQDSQWPHHEKQTKERQIACLGEHKNQGFLHIFARETASGHTYCPAEHTYRSYRSSVAAGTNALVGPASSRLVAGASDLFATLILAGCIAPSPPGVCAVSTIKPCRERVEP